MSDPLLKAAERKIGTWVGAKYHLDRVLGVGGMGAVFEAHHRNGNRVAVKLLHADLARDEQLRTRFLREGYAANRLSRGVARVLDDDTDQDKNVFLVLEFLEGDTLEAVWERSGGRLPPSAVVVLASKILDVLQVAHDVGVIHRDIKPDNIFLTRAGELKILDFGIARLMDDSRLTKSGELMGTPAFMAPEQAGGRTREVDRRADIYSTGAMMFTLLTGQHVHEAATAPMQMMQAATQPARSLASAFPRASHDLASIVDVALAFEISSRWESVRAMRTALFQTPEFLSIDENRLGSGVADSAALLAVLRARD